MRDSLPLGSFFLVLNPRNSVKLGNRPPRRRSKKKKEWKPKKKAKTNNRTKRNRNRGSDKRKRNEEEEETNKKKRRRRRRSSRWKTRTNQSDGHSSRDPKKSPPLIGGCASWKISRPIRNQLTPKGID